MASPLFLWSQSSSASAKQNPSSLDPELKETPSIPKPKPKRSGKAPATTKKTPQRGLGVAQLERIRLQERIKKIPSDEIQTFPVNLPSIYEQQAMDPTYRYGAPVAYAAGSTPICYVPQYRVGFGPVSTIRSVLHEQYAMDRVRIGAGSLVTELPSNQTAVCVSDQCEFCVRTKRIMNENLGFTCVSGVDLMDQERRNSGSRMGSFAREREIKEYEFFPHNSIESNSQGLVGASSSSSADASSNLLDLSLKLYY